MEDNFKGNIKSTHYRCVLYLFNAINYNPCLSIIILISSTTMSAFNP
mgnify:CR=1 FL=1